MKRDRTYVVSREVAAPVEVMWEVLSDVERLPDLTPSMTSVQVLGDQPMDVGTRVRIRQPKLRPAIWVVHVWQPITRFAWCSRTPGVRTTGDHWIEPADGRSCTLWLSIRMEGRLAGLVWRLAAATTRRYVDLELAGLAEAAEKRAAEG